MLLRVKLISEITVVLVLIGFLILAFDVQFANAEPRTWIVDDDGPADFHTIGEAVSAASSGDVVFVRNGTYFERVRVNKALSLVGEDRSAVVIDGNGTTPLKITANNASISGFTMQGGTQTYPQSGIYVERADYCSITNNIAKDNVYGIHLWSGADNNTVSANIVTNNTADGIFLDDAAGNNVSGNNITGNFRGISLFGVLSFSNSIFGNSITSSVYGIFLADHRLGNYIWGNNIKNNAVGINGMHANRNCIYGNNITANKGGISLGSCDRNIVYHNNFINNTYQADIPYTGNNTWDDGYPSGGNYWSNYAGVDVKNGPGQDLPGSDGIGDTPYIMNPDNIDHYPLMNPYGAPPPPTSTLTITTIAGGATNPPPGTYSYTANSLVQVTAIPNTNYLFSHWELDGINVGSANPYTVIMNKNRTLKAVFSPIPPPPPPPKPVGGYSFPTEGYVISKPLTPYFALIAILTIGFATVKRKKIRKTK